MALCHSSSFIEHLPSPNRWLRSMVDTFGSGFLPQPQLKNFCNRTQQGE
jgi:hypothetical protein